MITKALKIISVIQAILCFIVGTILIISGIANQDLTHLGIGVILLEIEASNGKLH